MNFVRLHNLYQNFYRKATQRMRKEPLSVMKFDPPLCVTLRKTLRNSAVKKRLQDLLCCWL